MSRQFLERDSDHHSIHYELTRFVAHLHNRGCSYESAVREFRRAYLLRVLVSVRGNQCRAAQELHVHRNTLGRMMADLGLKAEDVRLMCAGKGNRRLKPVQGVHDAHAAA